MGYLPAFADSEDLSNQYPGALRKTDDQVDKNKDEKTLGSKTHKKKKDKKILVPEENIRLGLDKDD